MTEIETQTEVKTPAFMSIETNILGDFEIIKDVFNSSLVGSSAEKKCGCKCNCSKKGSRGTQGSGEQQATGSFRGAANASGNQIFKKMSPLGSPQAQAIFEEEESPLMRDMSRQDQI